MAATATMRYIHRCRYSDQELSSVGGVRRTVTGAPGARVGAVVGVGFGVGVGAAAVPVTHETLAMG